MATSSTKTAVVIADVVAWTTPREGKPDERNYHRSSRGKTIKLPDAEYDRLARYGAVAAPGEAAAAQVERDELDTGVYTDDELAALDASELAAYVGQHPDESLRVATLESARKSKARKTVLEATGYELIDGELTARESTGTIETGAGTADDAAITA